MASIEVEMHVTCSECGAELGVNIDRSYGATYYTVEVTPCDVCLDKARQEGRDEFAAENG